MRLFVTSDDYCFLKIKLLLAILDLSIPIELTSADALLKLSDVAKGLLLQTEQGDLVQHVSILKYLTMELGGSLLACHTPEDQSKNDQWIEFCWREIECPLQLLLTVEQKNEETQQAKADIAKAFNVINDHLSQQTYMVASSLSLTDMCVFWAWFVALEEDAVALHAFPAVKRFGRLIASLPKLKAVLKKKQVDLLLGLMDNKVETFGGKWDRHRIRVKELLQGGKAFLGQQLTIKGWVRTSRSAEKGAVLFVELTDGSTAKGVQLVLNFATTNGTKEVAESGGVGACIAIDGTVVSSPAKGQDIEIHVLRAKVLGAVYGGDRGEVGGKNYPMAKKQHTLEFLREKAHLRPRSKVFSAAMRIRHAMAFATHQFFNERGFVYVHTPLITAADCEGAGEQFVVTTLLPDNAKVDQIPVKKDKSIDFSTDFFGRRCCLTVSGQLNVETHACALSDVYTFGPTFRAENSHTSRHLAEFWMIEPEICFSDLFDDMALAEDYVRYCTAYALEKCAEDLHYFEHEYPLGEKGLKERLQNVAHSDFARITYTEAVELLQKEINAGNVQFSEYPYWGSDLGSEHERYITEKIYKKPTIVINYPKGIKAFYMKLNDDKETVAAMDILVPKIGELIGGSQREDDLRILEQRCQDMNISPKDIWWYADLRRYGTVPHAGFGLGFERLIMFITGLENIRDVIPFPRVPGHAEF